MKLIKGLSVVLSAVAMVASLCSCGCDTDQPKQSSGPKIATIDDLTPNKSPGKKATVVLAGSRFTVDLVAKDSGDTFEIDLSKHGESVDREIYRYSPSGFDIERVAGETYEPGIPLLRFPMVIGDTWSWQGSMDNGDVKLAANANVTTDRRAEFIDGQPVQAVVVTVSLIIGNHNKVKRELTFHFAKDHGLFQREFGESSVREPLAD